MKLNFYLLFLLIFILIDMSNEIKIILDHFTFSSLYFAFTSNPLSFFMIFSFPYLKSKFR